MSWLLMWMEEHEVGTLAVLRRRLRDDAALGRLAELAADEPWSTLRPLPEAATSIVAGRGIDLSGELDCAHPDCQRRQVDSLLGRVLLYFDRIVVAGPAAHSYAEPLSVRDEAAINRIGGHAETLLYLRRLGADGLLTFVQKPPACAFHYRQHAAEAGIEHVIDAAQPWMERLVDGGAVKDVRQHDDHWHYTFQHPELEHTQWGAIHDVAGRPTNRQVAESVLAKFVSHLVSDVSAARQMQLPLGAAIRIHEETLAAADPIRVDDIAFRLRLPVLDGVPLKAIVRLREEESDSFEVFRAALRSAIRDRLAQEPDNQNISKEIVRDVIDPALSRIRLGLEGAERTLGNKLLVGGTVGVLATTVGLITATPLMVGPAVAALVTGIPAAHKYFEERADIELSDMYFLWRAATRRRHQPDEPE